MDISEKELYIKSLWNFNSYSLNRKQSAYYTTVNT